MWGWLAAALIVVGVCGVFYSLSGMNWEAPQNSDWGNKFWWPSLGLLGLGVAIGLWRIAVGMGYWLSHG